MKELWLVLSLVALAWLINSAVTSQGMLLGCYTLPSAYLYGRRHATLTALASVLLAVYMRLQDPALLNGLMAGQFVGEDWLEIGAWGGTLVLTACLMGTLYSHKKRAAGRAPLQSGTAGASCRSSCRITTSSTGAAITILEAQRFHSR